MKGLHKITWILVIIGGLNWLLVGLFSWDVGSLLGGMGSTASRIVYVLVGISAVVELLCHKKTCKACAMDKMPSSSTPNM